MAATYKVEAKIWKYTGKACWYFLTVDPQISGEIKLLNAVKRGWGSVRVKVTIGKTTWQTSLFPSKEKQCYILPVKKLVRKAEYITEDSLVKFKIQLMDSIIA